MATKRKPVAKQPAKKAARKKAAAPVARKKSTADLRRERFVSEYLIDYNGRQAAIRAGYGPDRARATASELLAMPEIQAQVQNGHESMLAKNEATKEMVLERLTAIATADPRELTELHRSACRYCWGKDNLFHRTPREMREARLAWEAAKAALKRGQKIAPFDEAGGIGFTPKKDPNPNCPECFGDGEAQVVFKDTRDLSPGARLLFAGIEQTQHGMKVRMNSQPEALLNTGKHLGMFTQKHKLVGTGEGGEDAPATVGFIVLPPKAEEDDG